MPKTFCKDCGGIEIDEQEVCHCAESSIPSSDMLALFVGAARLQREWREKGLRHAAHCNYQRDDLPHCNCGISDLQDALRVYEDKANNRISKQDH